MKCGDKNSSKFYGFIVVSFKPAADPVVEKDDKITRHDSVITEIIIMLERKMRRFNISLFSFFAVITCLILLVVSIYERRRANEIEMMSIDVSSPEYRMIIAQDLQLMREELQVQNAIKQLETRYASRLASEDINEFQMPPVGYQKESTNIRNMQLKLDREKSKLNAMKQDVCLLYTSDAADE